MTRLEAQTYGRKITLKATAVATGLILLVFMFTETRGDFANGILFFFAAVTNIHVLIMLSILFGLTYLFAGIAGKAVILEKKNCLIIAIKSVLFIIPVVIIYASIVGVIKDDQMPQNFLRLIQTYFLNPLLQTGSLALIPMLTIWVWATNKMRIAEKITTTNT